MRIYASLLAASLFATSSMVTTLAEAAAVGAEVQAQTITPQQLESKAAVSRGVAERARAAADKARATSNRVVGTSTTTRWQRSHANVAALNAEAFALSAEIAFDRAEAEAANANVALTQAAELRARQVANDASALAVKTRAAAVAARALATAKANDAPNQAATATAFANANDLEASAYRLEVAKATTAQTQVQLETNFTKAKARVIAGRAIAAHRGIKGHLSLPLSMPLSKPLLQGQAEVGPKQVGVKQVGSKIVGTPVPVKP